MTAASSAQRRDESSLLPQHQELIARSGISAKVAKARGYRSVTKKAELRRLGFSDKQCRVPALLIPIWNVAGEIASYQIRPDEPRIDKNGKAVKYETPHGSRMVLDVPPRAREWIEDPARPLFITEGVRKADSAVSRGLCCVALLGVWNWRGSNERGGKVALPDWEAIALNGRDVHVAFDSDVMTKPAVHQAMARLNAFLELRGAHVKLIYLPPGEGGAKVGLDDYLAAGHDVADLLAMASDDIRGSANGEDEEEGGSALYRATESGLVWLKPTSNGVAPTRLSNFTAKIVGEVVEDDGAEQKRLLEIEARLHGRPRCFAVTAAEFAAMKWPITQVGAGAIVYAGFGLRDQARAAIQSLSDGMVERRVYAHTGWRQVGDAWCYLHAGGGIGPDGPVPGVEVRLPDALGQFELPAPATGDRARTVIRASLAILGLAPDLVTVPVFCAIWRAALGACDFSLHLAGPTGEGKTELAALAQQHWGAGMDARHLPGSWSGTGNALEGLAFSAQHTLLVVDDFAPAGGPSDVARTHREADRVLRAQGNSSGRLRMRSDATLKPVKPPRGLILSTGEDVPRGESLRARILVLELSPGMLDWERLTACQADAGKGVHAEALSGFVRWLAARYSEVQSGLREETATLRQAATQSAQHRRTPEIVASLAVGLRYFLACARDAGALSADEADTLWARGWKALGEAAAAQAAHQAAAEPTQRFLELLRAAIASGRAHVASEHGEEPEMPGVWGWRQWGHSGGYSEEWRAHGALVGWVVGDDLYLEPQASYAAVQNLARDAGESLSVAPRTLHKRLREKGLLVSTESGRKTHTVRKVLAASRRAVLHMRAAAIMPKETDQTDHGAVDGRQEAEDGQLPGQSAVPARRRTDHGTAQPPPQEGGEGAMVRLGSSGESTAEAPASSASPCPRDTKDRRRPERPCYACTGQRFWRPLSGPFRCAMCHPPATPSLVEERVDLNEESTR